MKLARWLAARGIALTALGALALAIAFEIFGCPDDEAIAGLKLAFERGLLLAARIDP